MTQAADLISAFERAAADAHRVEAAYRKRAAARIDELARERASAHRRLNLIRAIASALAGDADPEKSAASARMAVCRELGWTERTERQDEVLDRLTPVFTCLTENELPQEQETEEEPQSPALVELRAFEAWYRAETGTDFYDLFDRYFPETPRVDF